MNSAYPRENTFRSFESRVLASDIELSEQIMNRGDFAISSYHQKFKIVVKKLHELKLIISLSLDIWSLTLFAPVLITSQHVSSCNLFKSIM